MTTATNQELTQSEIADEIIDAATTDTKRRAPKRKKAQVSGSDTIRAKFRKAFEEITVGLVERDVEVELIQIAMVAGEHVLLVSDPGCAKSMLADLTCEWISGEIFRWTLNEDTHPEEILGHIDLKDYTENNVYRRVIQGKLPTAQVAFIDEIFKANSAILNSMLRIINERKFENGDDQDVDCPLEIMIGASNEWPNLVNDKLAALYDRFLFRKTVFRVSPAGRNRLMYGLEESKITGKLTVEELRRARAEAQAMVVSDAAKECFDLILADLKAEGIVPGDRRLRKAVGALKASAWLRGAPTVQKEDFACLEHVLWSDPVEHPQHVQKAIAKRARPKSMKVVEMFQQVNEIMNEMDTNDTTSVVGAHKKIKAIADQTKKMGKGSRVDALKSLIMKSMETIRENLDVSL